MTVASIYSYLGIYATHPVFLPSSEITSASLGSYPGEDTHPFIPERSSLDCCSFSSILITGHIDTKSHPKDLLYSRQKSSSPLLQRSHPLLTAFALPNTAVPSIACWLQVIRGQEEVWALRSVEHLFCLLRGALLSSTKTSRPAEQAVVGAGSKVFLVGH